VGTHRRVRVGSNGRANDEKSEVNKLARQFALAKRRERDGEAERKRIGRDLLPLMQGTEIDQTSVDLDDTTRATVKIKHRSDTRIDPERLKKAIGAQAFNRLTTATLDEAKVEAAIQLGELDPKIVSTCVSETETSYLEARLRKKPKR